MTLENVKKDYKYFCKLAKGEFNERDFDKRYGTNEGKSEEGITLQGKMTPQRVDLIKSNALRNKLDIEKKFAGAPFLKESESSTVSSEFIEDVEKVKDKLDEPEDSKPESNDPPEDEDA